MVDIKDKKDCCGCSACFSACPASAIKMSEDEEGFLYPEADSDKCVNCGLCERVCPAAAKFAREDRGFGGGSPVCYAAKSKNEGVLYKSSSGGVFPGIAEAFIRKGGVVFGARYDANFNVCHGHAESLEGARLFYTSKYVQSDMKSACKDAENFLKAGRLVLFSGTPCQIAGLRRFLRKDYDGLFCAEIFCHGVPSPKAWRVFLDFFSKKFFGAGRLVNVNFRNKKNRGWRNYNTLFEAESASGERRAFALEFEKNPYMRAFLGDFSIRGSCSRCPAKGRASMADISIGDFWGYGGALNEDNLGVSAVVLRTRKGAELFDGAKDAFLLEKADYSEIVKHNCAVEKSATENPRRGEFFAALNSASPVKNIDKVLRLPLKARVRRFLSGCRRKIFS